LIYPCFFTPYFLYCQWIPSNNDP